MFNDEVHHAVIYQLTLKLKSVHQTLLADPIHLTRNPIRFFGNDIRPLIVGRMNWLLCKSDNGATAALRIKHRGNYRFLSTVPYTLAVSCPLSHSIISACVAPDSFVGVVNEGLVQTAVRLIRPDIGYNHVERFSCNTYRVYSSPFQDNDYILSRCEFILGCIS